MVYKPIPKTSDSSACKKVETQIADILSRDNHDDALDDTHPPAPAKAAPEVNEVNIGDVDCDGHPDYAVKMQDLEGKTVWQPRLSSALASGSPQMVTSGESYYVKGDSVNFTMDGKEMEGKIVSFRVDVDDCDEFLINGPNGQILGHKTVFATVQTADGSFHEINTRSSGFQRIVTPEELPPG